MEDNEPESQSLSLQVQETARWAKVLSASCKGGSPEPGGEQGRRSPRSSRAEPLWSMPRETSVVWSSTLVCGAQLSQQWSGACLSYTLKVAYSSLLGLFDKCLGTPAGECGISPGDYLWVVLLCKHGCSDHVGRYVSLSDVFTLT